MKYLIAYLCLLQQPSINPQILKSLQYHPAIQHPHDRLRVTLYTSARSTLENALIVLKTDPLDALPAIFRYNCRLSYYNTSRIKFYLGTQTYPNQSNYYIGVRLKL